MHARAANQLEITVAQLASVAINEVKCGPCPFAGAGQDNSTIKFVAWCEKHFADLTVRQVRPPRPRKKKNLPLPALRAPPPLIRGRSQILEHADIINNYPRGVEALAKFAELDVVEVEFDDFQATLPREILSWFGKRGSKRGNATQAATYDNIRAAVKPLSLAPRRFVAVKGAKELDVTFAFLRDAARAKAGPRRDARERAVAAVAAALHRAGVVDRSRHEDRDPKKALLSFDGSSPTTRC